MESQHVISDNEIYYISQFINNNLSDNDAAKQYLPVETESLFQQISESQGVILAELITVCAGNKKEQVKRELQGFVYETTKKLNTFQINDNYNRVIRAAEAIGAKMVNIGSQDILSGKQYLIMGILWQIIKIGLTNKTGLHAKDQNQVILNWVSQTINQEIQSVDELKDGQVLTLLYKTLAESNNIPINDDAQDQFESILALAEQLGVKRSVRSSDLASGNSQIIFALLAETYCQFQSGFKTQEEALDQNEEEEEQEPEEEAKPEAVEEPVKQDTSLQATQFNLMKSRPELYVGDLRLIANQASGAETVVFVNQRPYSRVFRARQRHMMKLELQENFDDKPKRLRVHYAAETSVLLRKVFAQAGFVRVSDPTKADIIYGQSENTGQQQVYLSGAKNLTNTRELQRFCHAFMPTMPEYNFLYPQFYPEDKQYFMQYITKQAPQYYCDLEKYKFFPSTGAIPDTRISRIDMAPLLYKNRKFQTRVYVTVSCVDPLVVHIFKDGICYLANKEWNHEQITEASYFPRLFTEPAEFLKKLEDDKKKEAKKAEEAAKNATKVETHEFDPFATTTAPAPVEAHEFDPFAAPVEHFDPFGGAEAHTEVHADTFDPFADQNAEENQNAEEKSEKEENEEKDAKEEEKEEKSKSEEPKEPSKHEEEEKEPSKQEEPKQEPVHEEVKESVFHVAAPKKIHRPIGKSNPVQKPELPSLPVSRTVLLSEVEAALKIPLKAEIVKIIKLAFKATENNLYKNQVNGQFGLLAFDFEFQDEAHLNKCQLVKATQCPDFAFENEFLLKLHHQIVTQAMHMFGFELNQPEKIEKTHSALVNELRSKADLYREPEPSCFTKFEKYILGELDDLRKRQNDFEEILPCAAPEWWPKKRYMNEFVAAVGAARAQKK
ncbi:Putative_plastin [Hexamita inflata]|uniref:Plastin n=1 Tax=Hexamita inflata TaxID=28002 RepID=A0AA86N7P7_9EUKA|nr:Putative plastin [Hexamita inflata]